MRAAAWGIVGAVFGTMANLVRSVHYREYDPANELGYLARPFVGAELGFILFILWQTVTVAISLVIGEVHISAVFLYIFAASAGFGIDTLTQSFRNFLGREP